MVTVLVVLALIVAGMMIAGRVIGVINGFLSAPPKSMVTLAQLA